MTKSSTALPTISIICPLYNAATDILPLHRTLQNQQHVQIAEIIYPLTTSSDQTANLLDANQIPYYPVAKEDFSHSRTREYFALAAKGDIIVFLTQDVIIKDSNFLATLISPLSPHTPAVYARQIAKHSNIEQYVRQYNYPDQSFQTTIQDLPTRGLKTFFFSDAACAILSQTFQTLNGYDQKDLPISEDMYFAYKLIMHHYQIAYNAEAIVYHSHHFTLRQLYQRYKLTGQFMTQHPQLRQYRATKSGSSLAHYVLKHAWHDKNLPVLLNFLPNMATRYLGFQVGRHTHKQGQNQ